MVRMVCRVFFPSRHPAAFYFSYPVKFLSLSANSVHTFTLLFFILLFLFLYFPSAMKIFRAYRTNCTLCKAVVAL